MLRDCTSSSFCREKLPWVSIHTVVLFTPYPQFLMGDEASYGPDGGLNVLMAKQLATRNLSPKASVLGVAQD